MTVSQPAFNASNSIIVRLNIDNKIGMLASVTQTISEMHGVVGAIDLVQPEAGVLVVTSVFLLMILITAIK